MHRNLQLYTTAGCHLCEQAEAMFEYLVQNDAEIGKDFSLLPVEIAGDDALLEQYGVRIPVLSENDREIGWPFELEDLKEWLLNK